MYISLFFSIPFAIPIAIASLYLAKLITKKERQELELSQNKDLFTQTQKAVAVFKVVTILFFSIPLLLLIPTIINPPHSDAMLGVYLILVPFALCILISAIAATHGYNYLFYTASNKKAFFILAIPFIISTFLLCILATILGDPITSYTTPIISCIFVLAIMTVILLLIRKRLKKANCVTFSTNSSEQ